MISAVLREVRIYTPEFRIKALEIEVLTGRCRRRFLILVLPSSALHSTSTTIRRLHPQPPSPDIRRPPLSSKPSLIRLNDVFVLQRPIRTRSFVAVQHALDVSRLVFFEVAGGAQLDAGEVEVPFCFCGGGKGAAAGDGFGACEAGLEGGGHWGGCHVGW